MGKRLKAKHKKRQRNHLRAVKEKTLPAPHKVDSARSKLAQAKKFNRA